MKKTIKILAASLVIALFTAMFFATDTMAAGQNNLVIKRAGVSNVVHLDMEGYAVGSYAFESEVKGETAIYGWAPTLRRNKGESKNIVVRQQTGHDGVSTNKYMAHVRTPGSIHPEGTYVNMKIGSDYTKSHPLSTGFSYMVFDFDVCADEYVYMLDGKEGHGTEIPEGATNVSLSYGNPNIYLINRDEKENGVAGSSSITFTRNGNEWYITVGEKKAKLHDIAGAWNHVTLILCVDTDTESEKPDGVKFFGKYRYYLNGDFFAEVAVTSEVEGYVDSMRFNMAKSNFTESSPYFSMGYDNITANYYDKNYSSGEDVYGIDDYFKDPNFKNKKLSMCEDIVYVDGYSYQGSPTPFAVSLKHKDVAAEETFYSINAALAAIKNEDIVTLNSNLPSPFVPKSDGDNPIKLLTFKLGENVKFTLDEESKNYYKTQITGNIVTLKYDVENALDLLWYNNSGEGREVVLSQKLLPMYAPNPDNDALKIYGKTDISTNKINPTLQILTGWDFDLNGDGIGDKKKPSALTVADFLEIRDAGLTSVSILPEYKEVSLAFAIQYVDESGNMKLYAPDYDYEKMANLANLFDCIAAIDTTSEIVITLYYDLTLDTAKSIAIPAGKNVAIDLNGHTISQAQAESSTNGIFVLGEASKLSVFSSRKNGKIVTTGTAYGVFTAGNIDSAEINLGARYDKDGLVTVNGNNLSIYSGALFNFEGSATDKSNTKSIVININGGNYFGTTASLNGALIPITKHDVALTVFGAKIVTTTGEPVFSVNTAVAHSAVITVSSSTLASLDAGAIYDLIGNWSNNVALTLTKTTALGLDLTKNGISLGEDCKLSAPVSVTKDDLNLNENVDVTFLEEPATEDIVVDTETVTVEYTIITFKKDTESAE